MSSKPAKQEKNFKVKNLNDVKLVWEVAGPMFH